MPVTFRSDIDHFLSLKRIAVVGISHDGEAFSRHVFRAFLERGYDVVPVNANLGEAEGHRCYSQLSDVDPAVDGVVVMVSSSKSEAVVRECAAAGVKNVWLSRGTVSDAALAACREYGIEAIAGECPFMFLKGEEFPHNVHVWVKKLTFTYPR